jgi:hypothetical protein
MAEETEITAAKKRRVIHWNPEAGREQVARRWTWKRIVAWSVIGFFGLLFAAGIVIRIAKRVFGPEVFSSGSAVAAGQQSVEDASSAFVSRAKAEQMQELASKSLNEVKRIPSDHPVQLQQLILMEKALAEGNVLMNNHEFGKQGVRNFRRAASRHRGVQHERQDEGRGQAGVRQDPASD